MKLNAILTKGKFFEKLDTRKKLKYIIVIVTVNDNDNDNL